MTRWIYRVIFILVGVTLSAGAAEQISELSVVIQLQDDVKVVTVFSPFALTVKDAENSYSLPQGLYTFAPLTSAPAKQRFHLFSKTFKPDVVGDEKAYMEACRERGYAPESVVIGKKLRTESGRILDARVHWISLVQCATEAEAKQKKAGLEKVEQWTWMRPEITESGSGTVKLKGASGSYSLKLPVTLSSEKNLSVSNVDVGFWDENKKHLSYGGELELNVTTSGGLELLERLGVEEYLKGVLPSEMPALWPVEALKAQAVSARSEVLVNLSTKHSLEQFDFCAKEHCRAYRGVNRQKASTNLALVETADQILVQDGEIVETVFSANCGGWTENNDTVWFGPPNAALRGAHDLQKGITSPFGTASGVRQWLTNPPSAYCSGDSTGFRWTRKYSETEIHAMIKKNYAVGSIKQFQLGDRGVSGRLKWIRIHGTADTVTIKKELPIRRTLGGLPSAMFDLSVAGEAPKRTFTIRGGGRGHGVGLCQHGAHGMALKGILYPEILHHYFTRVTIERVQ